jgi:signal transduction histidine kinase/ABC-type uncharacterized transport system substrate-binding protein
MRNPLFGSTSRPSDVAGVVRWILASFVVIVAVGCPHLSADSTSEKNILVLYSFSVRENFVQLEPLKKTVRSRVPVPVNFYVEYLESQRFGNPGYREALKETIRQSYGGKKIDLVVVSAYPALRFAVDYRDQIFPGVPIVFIAVDASRLHDGVPWPGVTGVTTNVDVRGSLNLALHLHPDTQNIAVVGGDSEFESYWLRAFRDEVRQRQDKLKLIEMTAESTKQLLEQASVLPSHTIVFFGLLRQESSHLDLGPFDLLGAIAQRLPTYCIHPYCLDHGAVGGSYTDQTISSVKGGEIAARVLSGEKPEITPVEQNSVTHPHVDWRQLRHWNISESLLPPGTIVLYRQPTTWERNRKYILAGVAVIIVQALLIAGLLWQRRQRKFAAGALQKLGGLLIHAQEDERASIARELHDDFSQRLALQSIELTQLEHNLPESEFEERKRALKLLGETKEMSKDIRALSHQLHSSNLELIGLVSALRGLCAEITKNYKITVHFAEPEFPPDLTKDMELCLFRVAQEALANVIKHSQAGSAEIELCSNANGVSLRISDKGKGFDPDQKTVSTGIGLVSMRERLRVLDGRLSVRSEITRGTEVLAEIPPSAFGNKKRA